MNKILKTLLLLGTITISTSGCSGQSFGDLLKTAEKTANDAGVTIGNGSGNGALSNSEIIAGLKQALEIGAKNAGGELHNLNGYFGNQLIKILMPPEAKKVENTLRSLGMGAQVDKAILSMNRAAEDAAVKAIPIFVDAIKGMSIQDGMNILRGGDGAATNFLKSRTTMALTNAFRPVIENSLKKVDATKYWAQVFSVYNRLPTTTNKINTDLTGYVTERALSGMFVTIAEEENKIRKDPAARVTDLLRKVFGS